MSKIEVNRKQPKKRKKTGGRQKGVSNKVTADFREAVTRLIESATPKMVVWLERVALEDPAKALDTIHKLAEYSYPKLARTELQPLDKEGKASDGLRIIHEFVRPS